MENKLIFHFKSLQNKQKREVSHEEPVSQENPLLSWMLIKFQQSLKSSSFSNKKGWFKDFNRDHLSLKSLVGFYWFGKKRMWYLCLSDLYCSN